VKAEDNLRLINSLCISSEWMQCVIGVPSRNRVVPRPSFVLNLSPPPSFDISRSFLAYTPLRVLCFFLTYLTLHILATLESDFSPDSARTGSDSLVSVGNIKAFLQHTAPLPLISTGRVSWVDPPKSPSDPPRKRNQYPRPPKRVRDPFLQLLLLHLLGQLRRMKMGLRIRLRRRGG
jgi:hypothetical protein